MRSKHFIVGISVLLVSSAALASPTQQPLAPVQLKCSFESFEHEQDRDLECRARVNLCESSTGSRDTSCRNSVEVDCDNGFDLFDDESVKASLRNDDLLISARDRRDRAEISLRDYSSGSGSTTRFHARMRLIEKWGNRRLHGECVAKTTTPPPVPTGSCQPSSSLSVLVNGTDVVSYVPKGSWSGGATGVAAVNIEGSSITNTLIPTTNVVNSCASNPLTGQTVCTANNSDVYLLSGTTLNSTLTSSGTGQIGFSGGSCTNCGVAMDATHNRAVIGLSIAGAAGFQFLNLGTTPAFETAFPSPSGEISEDPLIDPIRNLLLSPAENGNYEVIDIANSTTPTFFENATGAGVLDSAAEDCSTGIALAPAEFSGPSNIFIADLTQATFTSGTPSGTWTASSQVQTLSESFLSAGASGMAIAQGTHTGVVTGEFGGNALTAISLPSTSGTGTPAIQDWVTCAIEGFSMGLDPHTVTAYQSPNGGNAIAVLANGGATQLAIVDLTLMLDPATVPRTVGSHACASGTLPETVVRIISVP